MANGDRGYLPIDRSLFDDPLWLSERFSQAQALLDLRQLAAYADHFVDRGNQRIAVRRGDVLTSQVRLAERWRWNRETVRAFLRFLEKRGTAAIRTCKATETGYTVVSLKDYDKFCRNGSAPASPDSAIGSAIRSSIDPPSVRHPSATIKEGKSGNDGKKGNQNGARSSSFFEEKEAHPYYAEGFEEFWRLYPKRWDEPAAREAWHQIRPDAQLLRTILDALRDEVESDQWQELDGRYIPKPARWLQEHRWERVEGPAPEPVYGVRLPAPPELHNGHADGPPPDSPDARISKPLARRLRAIAKEHGWDDAAVREAVAEFGYAEMIDPQTKEPMILRRDAPALEAKLRAGRAVAGAPVLPVAAGDKQ